MVYQPPMPPPNGMQPQFIVTIQPTGAMFDPPAKLTLPNVDGYAPGRQVEMFSYDHDQEEFVAIGLGTVSKDGKTVTSNPGVGVVKAGWHCGAQAGGNGCCAKGRCDEGDYCVIKSNDCKAGCEIDLKRELEPEDQIAGNCVIDTCGGGKYNTTPASDETKAQKESCKTCEKGKLQDVVPSSECCSVVPWSEYTLGAVVCCNKKKTACINPTPDPDPARRSCTQAHEDAHMGDSRLSCGDQSCAPVDAAQSDPLYSKAKSECYASRAEVICYLEGQNRCSTQSCSKHYDYLIDKAIEYGNSGGDTLPPGSYPCFH